MPQPHPFSLGHATLDPHPRPLHRSGKSLWFWIGLSALLMVCMGVSIVFFSGVKLAQALQFQNSPITFFEGVRLVGAGLFAHERDLRGYQDGRINILLLGQAGDNHPGKHLTDTIIILSIDLQAKRVALLSLPRDLLVPLPGTDQTVKLNTLYQSGLLSGQGASLIKASITTVTSLPIHYFATLDFDGFEKIIDTLGGISVEVMRDIHDTRYPGKNYSYETFELRKGWQKLDGKTALKYVRMRHDDPEGDFGRAKRQQQVLQAVREKAWSIPTLLNPIMLTKLMESLGASITSDITPEAARSFLSLANTLDTKNITTAVVDAWKRESLLRVTHIATSQGQAFALVPRSENWQEVQSLARGLFDQVSTEKQNASIKNESATILILVTPNQLSVGNSLATDIQETFPVAQITVRTIPSGLEKTLSNAIIDTNEGKQVFYTLDRLIKRYTLERSDSSRFSLARTLPSADLTIIYNRTNIPGLIHEAPPENMGDFAETE